MLSMALFFVLKEIPAVYTFIRLIKVKRLIMRKFEFYFDKFLSQKIEKEIKYIFISHLVYLEELANRGSIEKDEYESKRKEILERGNAAIRNIDEHINSIFSNLEII